jgi:hypothetical protein
MRRELRVAFCCFALLFISCKRACASQEPVLPEGDARHVLAVEGTTVRYNGQLLPWGAGVEPWARILGKPDRVVDGISVWDELGLVLFHQYGGKLSSFMVLLGRVPRSPSTEGEPAHWPRNIFPGRLTVDGARVAPGSTVAQINRDKRPPDFARGYLDSIFSYDLEGFYVRLDFGHDRSLSRFAMAEHLPRGP